MVNVELGIRGKVAVVTGGSEGIGKATALAFAREGARVAICGRRADVLDAAAGEIRAATGGEVLAVPTDVSDAGQVDAFMRRVVEQWGGVDILVNNAGTSNARSFETVTDEVWQADLELKLFGAIRTCRLAIPSMRARGGGRIINLTMIGAKQPGANSVPTSVSRAAGIALTKALSKELAKDKILVNTVCVGSIKSAQIERFARQLHPQLDAEAAYAEMGKSQPLGRIGEAEEVANTIVFLCSERASFISGTSVNVDGGVSAVI